MHVFQKKIAAHGKGLAAAQHGAVIAPAQQQGRPGLRKMSAKTGQNAVFRKRAMRSRGCVGRNHISSPESDIRSG